MALLTGFLVSLLLSGFSGDQPNWAAFKIVIPLKAILKSLGWHFNLKKDEAEVVESGGCLPDKVLEKCKERRLGL